jgi:hypothetical protein
VSIHQPGTRSKLTLTPKSAPVPPCAPVAQPTPADQAAAFARRAESSAVPLELFYLVWAPARKRPPKYRHATLEAAQAEAARLAALNPETAYLVYRCAQVTP